MADSSQSSDKGIDVGTALFIELIFFSIVGFLGFLWLRQEVYDTLCMGFIGFAYVCVALYALLHTYSSSCPNCRRIFVVEKVGTKLLGKRTGYETVTREEKNRNGDVTRTWKEQVHVQYKNYLDHFRCLNCSDEWDTKREVRSENFTN
ncbi:MAG: hypothetical protein SF162_10700 [bacterium]|nr:hypothetical protein [bacterium]